MKNYGLYLIAIALLLLLGACGGDEEDPTAKIDEVESQENNEPTLEELTFGETFYVEKKGSDFSSDDGETEKFNLTIDSYEIEQDLLKTDTSKDHNYLKLNYTLENVGDITVSKSALSQFNFSVYDENNVEISPDIYPKVLEGSAADVRPGGKLEGHVRVVIEKKDPVLMVYKIHSPWNDYDEYVIHFE